MNRNSCGANQAEKESINMKQITDKIANEVKQVLDQIEEKETKALAGEIQRGQRIFISGTGRSGLAGKMFAMRLMHSGYHVYAVGETITPSIAEEDLLIIISGSGTTESLEQYAKQAKQTGARLALVTTNKHSSIGELSDCAVRIPAATKKRLETEPETIQPLGSQFDQSAHLLLDVVIVYLLEQREKKHDTSLNRTHANLE